MSCQDFGEPDVTRTVHDMPAAVHYHERKGTNMNRDFVDVEYMRQTVENEALKVKTGIRAGDHEPIYNCYGVEPPPDGVR